jgi:hypothetical protein
MQDRVNSRSDNHVRTNCCCVGHKCCKGKYDDTVVTTLRTSTCDQVYGRPAITKQTERRYGRLTVTYCSCMTIQTIHTRGQL